MARRTCLVTGAGSGVGRATALLLDTSGDWRLALVGRTRSTLRDTASQLASDHVVIECDLAAPGAATRAAEEVRRFCGVGRGLDAIVNAAGVAPRSPVASTGEAALREAFGANAVGPALLVAALWGPLVLARGRVVNVSSFSAVDPFSGFLAYGASKAALESMTRSVNVEGGPVGVKAHTLRLGAVETPMLRRLFDEATLPRSDALAPEAAAAEIRAVLSGSRDDRVGGEPLELVVAPKDGRTFDPLPARAPDPAPPGPAGSPGRPPRWHLPNFFESSP